VLYAGTSVGVYKSANGGRNWTETANFAGDSISTLALHPNSTGGAADRIYAGTRSSGVWVSSNSGATWTQYVAGMANGASAQIKDLLVDPWAGYLYALTYTGNFEDAEGEVYAHPLNGDGTMAAGSWTKVTTGLSGAALHVMAPDNRSTPTAFYLGGEGIAFYRTTGGVTTGNPAWQKSITGMSNLIMARMPVLFSGEVGMSLSYTRYEDMVCFTVYVQDVNGNPPIAGSTFSAEYDGTAYYDITYGDSYTHQGTFRDPSDPYTNWPYQFCVYVTPDTEATFSFEAACESDAPGCSGLSEEVTIPF
jgi:adhesin/invasin